MEGKVDKEKMRQYLLGEMSQEEMAALEERYFSDDHCFEQLLMVEDELIDDSIRGLLSVQERVMFEKAYLTSPRRREKVEIAERLKKALVGDAGIRSSKAVEGSTESFLKGRSLLALFRLQRPAFRFAVMAAALVVLLGGSWLAIETIRLRSQLHKYQVQQETLARQTESVRQQLAGQQAQSNRLTGELERERNRRDQLEEELTNLKRINGSIVSFTLFPGLTRDMGESSRFVIPKEVEWIQFRLALEKEDQFDTYRAVLQTVEGTELWREDKLRASATNHSKSIIIRLPSRRLSEADYILTLSGATLSGEHRDISDYAFTVMKK